MRLLPLLPLALLALASLTACGGGGSDPAPTGSGSGSGGSAGSGGAGTGGGGSGSGGGGTGGGSSGGGGSGGVPTPSAAARFATGLGKPAQLLIGLGTGSASSAIQAQGIQVDLYDQYLTHYRGGTWLFNFGYSSEPGAYIDMAVANADRLGAVPMFTLYQFAYDGDENLSILNDRVIMQSIWDAAVVLFDRLGAYGKPALVNVEPDFWGYTYRHSPGHDPDLLFAHANLASDCSGVANTVTGIAQCMLRIARNRAPNARIGFPPSDFGFGTANVVRFMNDIGADMADFVIMQTLDRDAGCFEAVGRECTRPGGNWYWDANAYNAHFAQARAFHEGIGGLPLVWWQTPLGVPSASAGGVPGRYRDNRVDTFLRNPQRLVDAGGAAVVFSVGAAEQTTIETDGGQFVQRARAYRENPAALD